MSLFLTSPRTTHNLVTTQPSTSTHHHPITTTTMTLSSRYDPSPPPSMGPLRLSAATTSRLVTHETVVPGEDEAGREMGEGERGEISLPEDLLEVSGSVEYTSSEDEGEPEMQTTVTGEERLKDQMEQTSPSKHDGQSTTFIIIALYTYNTLYSILTVYMYIMLRYDGSKTIQSSHV